MTPPGSADYVHSDAMRVGFADVYREMGTTSLPTAILLLPDDTRLAGMRETHRGNYISVCMNRHFRYSRQPQFPQCRAGRLIMREQVYFREILLYLLMLSQMV